MSTTTKRRNLGAQTVSGVRRTTGRSEPQRPSHYMTKAESREINRALDDLEKRHATGTPPCPAVPGARTRRGMQSLSFRRFTES